MYCKKCGTRNSDGARFCCSCGSSLEFAPRTNENTVKSGSPLSEEVVALIGPKAERYASKFYKFKNDNKKASWNWAAFSFLPYWFIYRKMYGYGAVTFAIQGLLSLKDSLLISLISLAACIVMGIFADRIYMNRLDKLASRAKSLSGQYKLSFIQEHGGVSGGAVVVAGIIWLAVSFVLAYIKMELL